ncbi:MAG: tetratricopeptide repeat protein [Magnetococcus sp. YQC-5]
MNRWWWIGCLILLVAMPVTANSGKSRAQWLGEPEGERFDLILEIQGLQQCITDFSRREVLIRLDRPFDPEGLSVWVEEHGGWLTDIQHGYDTLLLQWSREVNMRIDRQGERVHMIMQRHAAGILDEVLTLAMAEMDEEARQPDLINRLLIAHAQVDLDTELMDQEHKTDHDQEKAREWVQLAQYHERQGEWVDALADYGHALEIHPGDLATREASTTLRRRQAATLESGLSLKHYSGIAETRQAGHLQMDWPLEGFYHLMVRMEGQRLYGQDAMEPLASPTWENDLDWQMALARRDEYGAGVTLAVRGRGKAPGMMLSLEQPYDLTTWRGVFQWHLPDLDETVALQHGGSRDQVAAGVQRKWLEDLETDFLLAVRQYNLEERDSLACGLAMETRVAWGNPEQGGQWTMGVEMERPIHTTLLSDAPDAEVFPYLLPRRQNLHFGFNRRENLTDYLSGVMRFSHVYEKVAHKNTTLFGLSMESFFIDHQTLGLELERGFEYGIDNNNSFTKILLRHRIHYEPGI